MDNNTLLISMMASYLAPVVYVYYKYSTAASGAGTRSISSIITSQEPVFATTAATTDVFQTRHFIAACMFIMACFTIVYEYQRCVTGQTWWSLSSILALLIGIFGVIYIPETSPVHYLFAGTAFIAILGFMTAHTVCQGDIAAAAAATAHDNLRILLYAQFLFMIITVIGVIHDTHIFMFEALFLVNFAVFYLYLHSISFDSIPFHSISFDSIPFDSIPFHSIRHSLVRGRLPPRHPPSVDAIGDSHLTDNRRYTDTIEARQITPKRREKPQS